MISKDKQYCTKSGHLTRIYAVDGEFGAEIHGAFQHPSGDWVSVAWDSNGRHDTFNLDLVEVKNRVKRTYFVNLYNPPEGESILYLRHEQAMANRKDGWVGCAKIKIDIEEGEQQV